MARVAHPSLKVSQPPPSPALPSIVRSPEVIDITHDAPTPKTKPSATSLGEIPPLPPSPSSPSSTFTALTLLPKPSDTYMSGLTTTSKRPASPQAPSRLINIKTKVKRVNPQLTKFFARRSNAKLIVKPAIKTATTQPNNNVTKLATDSAGLAH